MRSHSSTRRRLAAGLVAGTMSLAACGGGDDATESGASEAGAGDALPQVDESTEQADATGADSADADASEADSAGETPASATAVDLVGADVLPESDVASNPLPSVVVDDVNTGRKVNFRNLVPQEQPILLWMWAPH